MRDFHLATACISFLIVAMGFIHKRIQKSPLSEPIVALASGILLGPGVLKVLDLHRWGPFEKILEVACQLTIVMALMATAFRIPKGYLPGQRRLQAVLVFFGMIGMCAASTLLIRMVFGFDWLLSLLIGAVITPTDPVVASTLVSGRTAEKLLPGRLRHAISFESGANDGMAYPLVLLPLLLMEKQAGQAWLEWLIKPVFWETGGGVVLGAALGFAAGKILVRSRDAAWTSETILLSFALAFGFFVLGFLEVIGCNGIAGVFSAGYAANWALHKDEDLDQEKMGESFERVFTIPIFFLFGLVLPWRDWLTLGWAAVWIVFAVLLFRRLPVMFALRPFLGKLSGPSDSAMLGWFGPIGVAALYYMVHGLSESGRKEVWVVGSLIVFGSTLVHGLTGYPLARLYGRWTGAGGERE